MVVGIKSYSPQLDGEVLSTSSASPLFSSLSSEDSGVKGQEVLSAYPDRPRCPDSLAEEGIRIQFSPLSKCEPPPSTSADTWKCADAC